MIPKRTVFLVFFTLQSTVNVVPEQDQSTLLEIFQYPGFEENRITPLPFNVSLDKQIMKYILPRRYTLSKQVTHKSVHR